MGAGMVGKLGRGYLKRLHVNQHEIKANAKDGGQRPVLTVKTSDGKNTYGHEVSLVDEHGTEVARVVYSPDKPLGCGARVWIETRLETRVRNLDA